MTAVIEDLATHTASGLVFLAYGHCWVSARRIRMARARCGLETCLATQTA